MVMGEDSSTIKYRPFNLIATVRKTARGEKVCCLFVSGTTIRDLGRSRRNVCIEGDEGGEQVKLSGFEVIGVRMLHHDCNTDIGHSFITNWEFTRVISQAQHICETQARSSESRGSESRGQGGKVQAGCSLNVCVQGTGFAMLLLRVVNDQDLRAFVGKLEVGEVRAEELHLGGEENKVIGSRKRKTR